MKLESTTTTTTKTLKKKRTNCVLSFYCCRLGFVKVDSLSLKL